MMKINVVSRKWIKPQKPTPPNLSKLNLSFLDELSPASNVSAILFYPKPPSTISNPEERLQESLSKVLTHFYPLAGRYIHKDHSVDCADQGVEWVEAEAEAAEAELTTDVVEADVLNDLLPRHLNQVDFDSPTDPLVSIQMTVFKCGGLAIGISIWHRICDGGALGTFIKAWWNAASDPTGPPLIRPCFDSLPALFPRNQDYMAEFGQRVVAGVDYRPSDVIVCKRFQFGKEAIASVRSRCAIGPEHSRVRVVCAVMTKALMGVERRKHGEKSRASVVAQAVNMRGRTVPPVPHHAIGNMVQLSLITANNINKTEEEEEEEEEEEGTHHDIKKLADLFLDGLQKTMADLAEMLSPDRNRYEMATAPAAELIGGVLTGKTNVVMFTDISKLGLFEADFGWGKPVGLGFGGLSHENCILITETKESEGLQAWVHMTRDGITSFEQELQQIHKHLVTYT